MTGFIKKIKRSAIYPLVASMLLQAGCATHRIYSQPFKTGDIPESRIEFIEKDPKTLDELISITENAKETFDYMSKLDSIKERIKTDLKYNPKEDIRSLVHDIEESNLTGKERLSNQIKEFGYYRFDKVDDMHSRDGSGLLFVPGLGALALTLCGEVTAGLVLGGISLPISIIAVDRMNSGKKEIYYNKIYFNPYNDLSETVEKNLKDVK